MNTLAEAPDLSAISALSGLAVALTASAWAGVILIAAVCLGLSWLGCRSYPYTACPKCDALGRIKDPSGRNWRTCPKCAGAGQRPRWCASIRDLDSPKRRRNGHPGSTGGKSGSGGTGR